MKLLKQTAKEKYGYQSEDILEEQEIAFENNTGSITEENGHINFFANIEEGNKDYKKPNIEHEKEKKEIQEKYEKQIGYLTYLGQDTNEALGKTSWYNAVPDRSASSGEINMKTKLLNDPLAVMKKYLDVKKDDTDKPKTDLQIKKFVPVSSTIIKSATKCIESSRKRKRSSSENDADSIKEVKKRHKREKHKKKKSKRRKNLKRKRNSTSEDEETEEDKLSKKRQLEILRAERVKREKEERAKTDCLLAKLRGDPEPEKEKQQKLISPIKQKYNSQFNPELAKQNYDFN